MIRQEHWLIIVIGLYIFAAIIDTIVMRLALNLPTPYHFLTPENFSVYPLTSFSIFVKAAAIFITPLLLLSFAGWAKLSKGITVFITSVVLQLYALQDVATGTGSVPLEWAISFALAGLLLLIPSLIYIGVGVIQRTNESMGGEDSEDYVVKSEEKTKKS